MQRASNLLQHHLHGEAQVDENDVVEALYELKKLVPTPEVVELATKLEGIVILFLMREWEVSVNNVLTDYLQKLKQTKDKDFKSEMRFIARRAEALKDATVLSNPARPPNGEVEKRVINLLEVIKHVDDYFLGVGED